jgi:aminoglycoside phosphotransferase
VHLMRHGYTNDTRGDGAVVVKRYVGPAALARRDRERSMLERLRGVLPVATIVESGPTSDDDACLLQMSHLDGVHGQELIDDGRGRTVLRSCGEMLRQLQSIPLSLVFPNVDHAAGGVLVHGDYGPNNMLFDPRTVVVTGLLDWEWAHVGRPIEDLAWCEWIVRMHHPGDAYALDELFEAYGDRPPWSERRAEMVRRCQELLKLPRPPSGTTDAGDVAVEQWRQRVRITESWAE